ncbi:polysaccharide biosynthesis protein [Actinomycetota bacterium]
MAKTASPARGYGWREIAVRAAWIAADMAIITGAVYAATFLRFDLRPERAFTGSTQFYAVSFAGIFGLIAGVAAGFARAHQRGSFEETAQVLKTLLTAAVISGLAVHFLPPIFVPRSVPLIAPAVAMLGMFALRFVVRSYRWGRAEPRAEDKRVVVYGAGEGGRQLIRALQSDTSAGPRLIPVAIVDDDPLKRRWRLDGVRVRGGLADLPHVAKKAGAQALVVAIPSIEQAGLRRVQDLADELDLEVLVLPTPGRLLGAPKGADLRRLDLEDLLGRRQVELDATAIAEKINGRVVLVTGAGGSIGSELCRQISRFRPARLILLDRDESALHGAQMSLTGRALLDDGSLALCDIRDFDAVLEVMERERPDIVFHAAALKHLTLLEQFPLEAWKTNVIGSLNVLQAANRVGVGTFVNISTDKAADPTCVLGYSKRIAERLTADYASRDAGVYVSVRFGNVLGSRGSVITAFTAQIEQGRNLTVTHPDVERYFMLIPEACQLVLQAATIGRDGEVMVLDMGEPVKILDVAKQLIRLSGKRDIGIDFTGLRPGEKLSEDLFSSSDAVQPTSHPLVSHVVVPPLRPSAVRTETPLDGDEARRWMYDESIQAGSGTEA